MKKFLTFTLFIGLFSCYTSDYKITPIKKVNNVIDWSNEEKELFSSINKFREENKLTYLIPEASIREEASRRIDILINLKEVNHVGFSESVTILTQKGFSCISEVIASGYTSIESVTNAFINSAEHNSILKKDCPKYVGVSIKKDNEEHTYYLIIFAK